MKYKTKRENYWEKYKHGWVFLYLLIYMPWFFFLEKHVTKNYLVIHSSIDDKIPFIEYFIVPYLLWFVFIAVVFLYFFFTDVQGFYKLALMTFTGMTIFLVICTVIPNGLDLRPVIYERNNIFVDMVKILYRADTPTNVLPSLHVFNTLSVCIAMWHSSVLRKHRIICGGAYILSVLIILATVFLKQHSVIDVSAAFLMALVLRMIVYAPERDMVPSARHAVLR